MEGQDSVVLLTHQYIKEDGHSLFGFSGASERKLFRQLITVSGIGPSTARIILSGMTPAETRNAIATEQSIAFKKVKGVGPKTAQRIILDLKDKVLPDLEGALTYNQQKDNTIINEALSALVALGYKKIQVQKLLNTVVKDNPELDTVEKLIKEGLKQLS